MPLLQAEKGQEDRFSMENQLFRKKSMDRISSPEELHDYLRVTSPRLWMILGAIVVLLVGFIAYASTATLENTMPIQVKLETYEYEDNGQVEKHTLVDCTLPLSELELIQPGMTVRFAGQRGKVNSLYTVEDRLGVLFEMENAYLGLPDGLYDAELVLESTTPIRFLWN